MALPQVSLSIQLTVETCITCGIQFGVPGGLLDQRRRDHTRFYCPNGHNMFYPSESDAERGERLLREEQARHQRTLARENEAIRLKNEAEAETARLQKRVAKGACPCCKRSFTNLHRHISTKHPDFGKKK